MFILKAVENLAGTMNLLAEKERICKELGDKNSLSASLGNQALIHYARGEMDEAMRLHKEKERIYRELGNKEGLAISLTNQAELLHNNMNKTGEALLLAEEAYRIATDHGLTALAQQIKPFVDKIKNARA